MEMGIVTHISRFARPLVEVAHLPEANASALIVSLGSTVAANGIVAGFRKEGALTDSEVILCAVMNGIPFYLREIFTYHLNSAYVGNMFSPSLASISLIFLGTSIIFPCSPKSI